MSQKGEAMVDNGMKILRCAIGHGEMVRLQNRPEGGLFSLWLCESCGDLALHMELRGDIYWFKTAVIDRTGRRPVLPPAHPLPESRGGGLHQVKCDSCPVRFGCGCGHPDGPHICMGCDSAAEESKMIQLDGPAARHREIEAAAYQDEDDSERVPFDEIAAGEEDRVRQQDEADDRQAAALDGEDLPW